jgi:hypothetical protein
MSVPVVCRLYWLTSSTRVPLSQPLPAATAKLLRTVRRTTGRPVGRSANVSQQSGRDIDCRQHLCDVRNGGRKLPGLYAYLCANYTVTCCLMTTTTTPSVFCSLRARLQRCHPPPAEICRAAAAAVFCRFSCSRGTKSLGTLTIGDGTTTRNHARSHQ